MNKITHIEDKQKEQEKHLSAGERAKLAIKRAAQRFNLTKEEPHAPAAGRTDKDGQFVDEKDVEDDK